MWPVNAAFLLLSFLSLSAIKLLLLLEGRIIFKNLLVVLESPRNV